jgi:short-chain Z-isoprenyl diphosphate synthase
VSGTSAVKVPTARRALDLLRALQKPIYWWYEQKLLSEVKGAGVLPQHLGLILDGNRRFAKANRFEIRFGHQLGAHKAYEVLEWCLELGVPHVTLWVFSSDNRSRDPQEISDLLDLFAGEAVRMVADPRIHNNQVRIKLIGQIDDFPERVRADLSKLEQATAGYKGMLLNIAIGYGGREEVVSAMRALLRDRARSGVTAAELATSLGEADLRPYLYTAGCPDPDFIIRTSGEVRMSGFLLWQSAYSEYYFCDAYWPNFRKVDFLRALRSFQSRHRRYGR